MSAKNKHERTPEELLRAIDEQHAADEAERIRSLSDEEVTEEIRAAGGDPDAIGRRGAALAARLLAKRRREAWQEGAVRALRRAREILDKPGLRKTRGLSREALLERIEAARSDPRLREPIAVAFRDKKLDTSSEAELEAILDAIEDLARLAGEPE